MNEFEITSVSDQPYDRHSFDYDESQSDFYMTVAHEGKTYLVYGYLSVSPDIEETGIWHQGVQMVHVGPNRHYEITGLWDEANQLDDEEVGDTALLLILQTKINQFI